MKETRSTLKAVLSTGCLFLTLGVLTINFQNCSGLSSADYGSNSDTVSQGESGLIPVGDTTGDTDTTVEANGLTAIFADGDRFTGQTLVASGSFLDSLIDRIDYETYSNSKAIAVATSGLGYAALTAGNSAEAERMAVESCNLLSGEACALIVSGNLFVVNSTTAFAAKEYKLNGYKDKAFNRGEIPMSASRVRSSSVVTNFINAPGHRALAISITGGVYSVYTATNSLTRPEVKRMALQRCELEAAIVPCVLYAVNETVVFDPMSWIKNSSINFSNNNVVAEPPPASRYGALTAIENLLDEVDREKYAIYITPSGYGYFGRHATDVEEARSEALAYCEAGVHGSRCIPYASSTGINLSPDDLKAKSNFSELFCKTVRYNCAAHLEMGCVRGAQYWVQNPGTLEAELASCGN
ncbi:MAG: hypothetical protein ACRBBP_04540 [Bdellovibrionales bacterium]